MPTASIRPQLKPSPDHEGPSYGDRPELLSRRMSMLCVAVTSFSSFDDVDSILLSRQPKETVPERLGDQRLCRHVMPTFAGVDLLKDLSPFFWRNTSLKNAGRAPFIKQSVNDRVRLCSVFNLTA